MSLSQPPALSANREVPVICTRAASGQKALAYQDLPGGWRHETLSVLCALWASRWRDWGARPSPGCVRIDTSTGSGPLTRVFQSLHEAPASRDTLLGFVSPGTGSASCRHRLHRTNRSLCPRLSNCVLPLPRLLSRYVVVAVESMRWLCLSRRDFRP